MTGQKYELKIKKYFEKILRDETGHPVEVKHNETMKGKSGTEYQIDLSYRFSVARYDYLTIIECKCWNRSVSQNIISQVNDIKSDLNAQKAIVVSAMGFQRGALLLAKHAGIGLVKITNKLEETRYLNLIGLQGRQQFESIITEYGDPGVLDNDDFHGIGLAEPGKSIEEFFSEQYSPSVLRIINRFETDRFDLILKDMNNTLKEAVTNIPTDWYRPYLLSETAGLGLRLYNEAEINKLKGLVTMARMVVKNTD